MTEENKFKPGNKLYSYKADYVIWTTTGHYGGEPMLIEWTIVKETPKGVWIKRPHQHKLRWTSKTAVRRIAYPSEIDAWNSFLAKRKKYVSHCEHRLEAAEIQLREAEKLNMIHLLRRSK